MYSNLQGKKILFIAPVFYDYNVLIRDMLENFGAQVVFFAEREYSFKFTMINNFFHSKLDEFQEKHYLDILKKSEDFDFDYLFIIKGYKIPISFCELFIDRYPKAKKIMYQWDSENNNNFFHVVNFFDSVFSFDRKDVEINPKLKYLPLFYTNDIESIKNNSSGNECKYDILYFGYYLPERYEAMLRIIKFAKQNSIQFKTFLYMPFSKFIKECLKGHLVNLSLISFSPLKRSEYLNLLSISKTVFDTSSKTQTGLSMRVIETIGAGKKLLTSNKYIQFEKGFNKDQICVLEMDSLDEIPLFLQKTYIESNVDYSLSNWISTIFKLS